VILNSYTTGGPIRLNVIAETTCMSHGNETPQLVHPTTTLLLFVLPQVLHL